jgi:hypothetical protein
MRQQSKTVALNRVANAAATAMLIAIAWMAGIIRAHADGGAVQFEKSAGPFIITVFTTPSPLRAGPVDISLMIQSRDSQQPVLDCQAFVQLRKEGAMSIRSEATREAAQNKLLYAAPVKVPETGLWELEVAIRHGDDSINVAGEITVAPANPVLLVYWRSLVLPPLFISLFAVNQWLKQRGGAKRQRSGG